MSRETLKDFLSENGFAGVDAIQYTLNEDANDLGKDTHTGEDLIGSSGIIGDFLKYVAENRGNFYEFEGGNATNTTAGKRGDVLYSPDQFISSAPFIIQGSILAGELEKYSNSRYFDDPDTGTATEPVDELNTIINKVDGSVAVGSEPTGPRTANNLLKDVVVPVESDDPEDFVVQASVAALKRNSRFNMDDEFYQNVDSLDTSENYQFVRDDTDYYTSFEKLKDAGASLLLKATGYDTTPGPRNEEGFVSNLEKSILEKDNSIVVDQETSVAMPSSIPGEEVPKLTAESLRSRNATGVPNNWIFSSRINKGSIAGDRPSFGVTYNQALKFEDTTPTHKIKTALRMIALFTFVKSLLDAVFEALGREDKKAIIPKIKNIAQKGENLSSDEVLRLSRSSNKFIVKNYLFDNLLTPTDFPYEACFNRGIKVVFGSKNPNPSNVQDVAKHIHDTYDSPGFWLAMSNSAIKKTFLFGEGISEILKDGGAGSGSKDAIKNIFTDSSAIARIANVFAMIGEKSLHHTNGLDEDNLDITKKVANARDVDSLDNIPGNRVGKSRRKGARSTRKGFLNKLTGFASSEIGTEKTLFWEQGDVPSAYILPLNILRAASDLNNTVTRTNPARGMLGSRLVRNTYTGIDTDGTAARIPERVVKILEDRLDSEYVPFYIQDLRTNEIISFHAFLSQLTDTISPSFLATPGYGRMDPVQTYQSTTRSLQVGFTVYSTNREDFDDMWYKINKFVTLLYPQWTQGTLVQTGDPDKITEGARFVQPFSQKIGASPIVRLRIGDVVKSNYSRFALARTFGIGDAGVKANPVGYSGPNAQIAWSGVMGEFMRKWRDLGITIFATIFGSPQGLLQIASDKTDSSSIAGGFGHAAANIGFDYAAEALATILVNGFANPLLTIQTLNRLKDPNVFGQEGFAGLGSSVMYVYLNPNMIEGYSNEDNSNKFFTSKRVLGKVKKKIDEDNLGGVRYVVEVLDRSDKDLFKESLVVKHEDIWNDPTETFTKSVAGIAFSVAGLDLVGIIDSFASIGSKAGGTDGAAFLGDIVSDAASLFLENPESIFMRPEVNPYVRAFESTKGRGLAGVIKTVTFNWLDDFPWETDHNARAPIGCNITFSFDVIHDIPPGLDHTGYNRAPLYNVGEIMKNVSGDVYDDKFSKSERMFRMGGATAADPGTTVKKRG